MCIYMYTPRCGLQLGAVCVEPCGGVAADNEVSSKELGTGGEGFSKWFTRLRSFGLLAVFVGYR